MAWMDRFRTLLAADAHGVIDALEDRALLLRQHLREARQAVATDQARLEALDAEARDLEQRRERLDGELAALERDVDLALGEERDDLARFAVRKLLPRRAGRQQIVRRRAVLEEERDTLAGRLAERQTALEELERRVKARLAQLEGGSDAFDTSELVVTDDDVELELLRRRRGGPDYERAAEGGA